MEAERRFQRRLKQLVKEAYGSLDRFYLETDFSKGHLSHIVRGTQSPSVSTLTRLAKLLRVELRDFFVFPDHALRDRVIDVLARADSETVQEVMNLLEKRVEQSRKRRGSARVGS